MIEEILICFFLALAVFLGSIFSYLFFRKKSEVGFGKNTLVFFAVFVCSLGSLFLFSLLMGYTERKFFSGNFSDSQFFLIMNMALVFFIFGFYYLGSIKILKEKFKISLLKFITFAFFMIATLAGFYFAMNANQSKTQKMYYSLYEFAGGEYEEFPYSKYQKNNLVVLYDGKIIAKADPKSFKFLADEYARDNGRVYYNGKLMIADTGSFEALTGEYARDKNHIYYLGSYVISKSPKEFQVIYVNKKIEQIENQEIAMPYYYGKNESEVFFNGALIKGANPETFEVLKYDIAKDDSHLYSVGRLADFDCDFDYETLKVTDYLSDVIIFSDKNGVYETFQNEKGAVGIKKVEKTASEEAMPLITRSKENLYAKNLKDIPAIIYLENGGDIWRKIGNGKHEKITEITDTNVHLNPYSVTLSPENRYLIINLKKQLKLFDLKTEKYIDFFSPKKKVYSYAFSPDGKRLLIWDAEYGTGDYEYFIHEVNFPSGESRVLKQGNDIGVAGFSGWRRDGKIMLHFPSGEVAGLGYYDMTSNEIKKIEGRHIGMWNFLSRDGEMFAIVNSSTDDVCNDFSGSAPDGYKIVEAISGENIGEVKIEGKGVNINFSSDNKQIVMIASSVAKNREECENFESGIVEYYIADISGNNLKKINQKEYENFMRGQEKEKPYAEIKYLPSGERRIIMGKREIVRGSQESGLELIGSYYQK